MINVITRDGDFSAVRLPGYATRLQYRTIDPVRSFVSPAYTSESAGKSRIPDFRNTLYWNPSLTAGENGQTMVEFWSSDVPGDYEIKIEGIANGKLVSCRKILRIE